MISTRQIQTSISILAAIWVLDTSSVYAQETNRKHVTKEGVRKTVVIVKNETELIEEKTLRLAHGATGTAYYEFRLAPHEKINFELETEDSNQFQMRLATIKDPSLPPDARMEALSINESLKSSARQNFSYENRLNTPYSIILHLKGRVNYWFKIKIKRTPAV